MTDSEVLDIMYQTFQLAMNLALPFLLISMIVGIIIAIFQAATQINEQSMSFVPKLIALIILLGATGSTMLEQLQDFTRQIMSFIAGG